MQIKYLKENEIINLENGKRFTLNNTGKLFLDKYNELGFEIAYTMTNLKRGELIHVLWWFSEAPRDILKNYVNEDDFETGVFAMRSPHRPNPIALSLCEVKDISNNIITVRGIEALDGSPILDIKKAIIRDGVIL